MQLYRITTINKVLFYWARNDDHAFIKYQTDHPDDNSPGVMVEAQLTDQGYPIVRLKDIKKGWYFHRINKRTDGLFCELSTVWCKDDYDPSTKKFFVHKYEDVNDSKLLKGDTYVTVDFTF